VAATERFLHTLGRWLKELIGAVHMALLVKNFRRNRMVELNVGFEVTVS